MAKEPKRIDISSIPELLHIAHEVQRTNEPRLLRQDNEDVAILMPIKAPPKRRSGAGKTKEDYVKPLSRRQVFGKMLIQTS
jgi:hypothetical protein